MGKHVHPSCSLLWQNSKTFIFSLFFKTTHQSGCWRLIFAFQKVVLKLQFVLVCISVSTVIAGSALATEHVGESSWVWLQCGGRCVGLSLRVWGAHDPGGKDPQVGNSQRLVCCRQPAQVLKQPEGMVSLSCPFRRFSASFCPSFLHA